MRGIFIEICACTMRGRLARSVYEALDLDADQLNELGQSDSKYGEYRAVKTEAVQSTSEKVLVRACVTDQESRERALRVVGDNDDLLRTSSVVRLLDKLVVPLVDDAAVCRALCDRMVELVAFHAAAMSCGGDDLMASLERDQQDAFRAEFERHALPCSASSGRGGHQPPHASATRAPTVDRPLPTGPRSSGGGGGCGTSRSGTLPRQRFQQLRTAADMPTLAQRARSSPGALVLDEALACNFPRSESARLPAVTGSGSESARIPALSERSQQCRPLSGGGGSVRPPLGPPHSCRPHSASPSLCLTGHQRQQQQQQAPVKEEEEEEEEQLTTTSCFCQASMGGSSRGSSGGGSSRGRGSGGGGGGGGGFDGGPGSYQPDKLFRPPPPLATAAPCWWGPAAPLTAYMMQRSGSWQAQPQLCAPSEWGCGRMWSSSGGGGGGSGGVAATAAVAADVAAADSGDSGRRSVGGGLGAGRAASSSSAGRGGGGSSRPLSGRIPIPGCRPLVAVAPPPHLRAKKTVVCSEMQDRIAVMLRWGLGYSPPRIYPPPLCVTHQACRCQQAADSAPDLHRSPLSTPLHSPATPDLSTLCRPTGSNWILCEGRQGTRTGTRVAVEAGCRCSAGQRSRMRGMESDEEGGAPRWGWA